MEAPSVSVVVPVYNSESSLPILVDRLVAVLDARRSPYELIFVNDGSIDGSAGVLDRLAAARPSVHCFHLTRNYGQHNAILCGIRQATYDVIVILDDDLQHPPEEIPKLLAKMQEGHDVVYGRPDRDRHGFLRALAASVTKLALQTAMGAETARDVGPFKAFRTDLRDAFADYRGSFVSIDVLLTWATRRFSAVTVRHEPRTLGTSQYTFRLLVTHALNMMTGFSTMPLQLASIIGFTLTVFGIVVLVYVLTQYVLEGRVAPGFTLLASIVAIFSGAQLFALGIIGEYLARMYSRVIDRPSYTVRRSVRGQKVEAGS